MGKPPLIEHAEGITCPFHGPNRHRPIRYQQDHVSPAYPEPVKVLVFEDNLLWSVRLSNSLKALGHEPVVISRPQKEAQKAEAAIVNLSSTVNDLVPLVAGLRAQGTYVIAHAGHKDKALLASGKEAQCDAVVTNGTLTHKLADVLLPVKLPEKG